jgi:hypothetical protein
MYNGNLTIAECGRSGKTINKNSERIVSFERKNRKHKIFQLIFPPQRERERELNTVPEYLIEVIPFLPAD